MLQMTGAHTAGATFNHKSHLNAWDPGNQKTQQRTRHMWLRSWQQYLSSSAICLFVYSTAQRLRTAPGTIRNRPTDPMPYRDWHFAVYVSMHPFFFFSPACTYGQAVSLGLVSLQILFGEIASWLVCSEPSICWVHKIRNRPSSKCKMLWQQHL